MVWFFCQHSQRDLNEKSIYITSSLSANSYSVGGCVVQYEIIFGQAGDQEFWSWLFHVRLPECDRVLQCSSSSGMWVKFQIVGFYFVCVTVHTPTKTL